MESDLQAQPESPVQSLTDISLGDEDSESPRSFIRNDTFLPLVQFTVNGYLNPSIHSDIACDLVTSGAEANSQSSQDANWVISQEVDFGFLGDDPATWVWDGVYR